MNSTFERIKTGSPRAAHFIAIFLIAFSLGSFTFYMFSRVRTGPAVTSLDAPTALPESLPKFQPAEPAIKPGSSPFEGLWRAYRPSEEEAQPGQTRLPIINLVLYVEHGYLSGKAFFYEVRDDGHGEYVEEVKGAVLTKTRVRKGALYFHIRDDDGDIAYKLWLVNHDEARLRVVGEGPTTAFRVKRAYQ